MGTPQSTTRFRIFAEFKNLLLVYLGSPFTVQLVIGQHE